MLNRTILAATLAGLFTAAAQAADYQACADAASAPSLQGSLCSTASVPAWHDAAGTPSAETLQLFVRKFPAAGIAKGSVWLVAGGPGESGAGFYGQLATLRRSFPGFDLLVPDHRGTGFSAKLCPDEEAVGSPGGLALQGAEWGACFARLYSRPELAERFSITNAAHDLRLLIDGQRDGKPVYLYGVSYGTQLALRTMQLPQPPKLNGIVLDSLVPPQTAPQWDLSRRSFVVDQVGRQVLAQCDAAPDCRAALGEPAEVAYHRLLASAAGRPELLAKVPGKNLKRFLGGLLDVPAARARLPYLIQDLAAGRDGELAAAKAAMEQAYAGLGSYAQSPLAIPLVAAISRSENTLRPALTLAQIAQEDEALLFTSPLPGMLVNSTLPTYAHDRYFGLAPARLPSLLVLQGTLDPKTHYDGARAHAAALGKAGKVSMVAVAGAPHFVLWTAPACFEQATRAFVAGRPAAPRCAMAGQTPTGQH